MDGNHEEFDAAEISQGSAAPSCPWSAAEARGSERGACPSIPQQEFDVPLDGLSDSQSMFVFFSTDHFRVEDRDLMGRLILARSYDDGLTFEMLYTFTLSKFINVLVERLSLEPEDARRVGVGSPDVLRIWGSGRYRSSEV